MSFVLFFGGIGLSAIAFRAPIVEFNRFMYERVYGRPIDRAKQERAWAVAGTIAVLMAIVHLAGLIFGVQVFTF